ncbi:50S ribosomal protein L6 [Candidatus Nitrosopelagicus sp.]|nr:50S ribosomal protein L6 [Candidatus Nitrosopelagicus sp.]
MSTSQIDKLATELEIPDGVTVSYDKPMIIVQGPLGKTWKSFKKIPVTIDVTDGKVNFKAQGTRDKNRAIMNTSRSLIRNLCEGVVEGYTIKMKIVFSQYIMGLTTFFIYPWDIENAVNQEEEV